MTTIQRFPLTRLPNVLIDLISGFAGQPETMSCVSKYLHDRKQGILLSAMRVLRVAYQSDTILRGLTNECFKLSTVNKDEVVVQSVHTIII